MVAMMIIAVSVAVWVVHQIVAWFLDRRVR